MQRSIIVRRHEGRVLLIADGRLVADLPWQAALEVGRSLRAKAREAEATARADAIAEDQALLLRAGVPLALSADPRVMDEAARRAAWSRHLRRAIPGGVPSREAVGGPRVVVHPNHPTR